MPEEVGAMGCAANRKSLPAWCVAERACSAALYIRAPSIRLCAFRFSCECGCECHCRCRHRGHSVFTARLVTWQIHTTYSGAGVTLSPAQRTGSEKALGSYCYSMNEHF